MTTKTEIAYNLSVVVPGVTALVGTLEAHDKQSFTVRVPLPRTSSVQLRRVPVEQLVYAAFGKVGEDISLGYRADNSIVYEDVLTDVQTSGFPGMMEGTNSAGETVLYPALSGQLESDKLTKTDIDGAKKKHSKSSKEEKPKKKGKRPDKVDVPSGKKLHKASGSKKSWG